jgi:hypothetical protein
METTSAKPDDGSSRKPAGRKRGPKKLSDPKAEKPVVARKKRTVKTTASKIGSSLLLDPKPASVEPVIPHEEISLRAYFIAERRHKMGWPGDPASDWVDALNQLRAEHMEKPLAKR